MRQKYYYSLLFLLLTLCCCKKSNNAPSTFTESSYPLAVGDWWQYQFTDIFLGGGIDTFTLIVDSMSTVGSYTKSNCSYVAHGTSAMAGYFLQSDTSMSFVNVPNSYFAVFPSFHLKFPIETGQSWPGAFPGDSILVAGVTASCQGGNGNLFDSCFITVEKYNLPHNFKVEDMYLSPKIGLVYQWIDFNSDTAEGGVQINQSITLLNYHVQ